jgi:hypothetical protein
MGNEGLNEIRSRVLSDYRSEWLWTKLWSFVHHSFVFGAAAISALAALLLQLDLRVWDYDPKTVGKILAMLAALCGTISGAGGFGRKWRTNRHTRNRLDELRIDLTNPNCKADNIREKLIQIWKEHDKGIVGGN